MNWGLEDPVSHMCLADIVLASWPLTEEVVGSNPPNDKYFAEFSENIQENLKCR